MTKTSQPANSNAFAGESLSSIELLAIVLDDCTQPDKHQARRVLDHVGGLEALLRRAEWEDFAAQTGISEGASRRLHAVIELARRIASLPPPKRDTVQNAEDAIHLVSDLADVTQEHVRVILLDSGQKVVAIETVYVGTSSAAVVRTAEVYREAILRNSPALILVHNHPSGDPTPSPEDIEFTRALYSAAGILDIEFVDHLIIGRDGWRSLKAMGFIPH